MQMANIHGIKVVPVGGGEVTAQGELWICPEVSFVLAIRDFKVVPLTIPILESESHGLRFEIGPSSRTVR
jgi:hypothetical protein